VLDKAKHPHDRAARDVARTHDDTPLAEFPWSDRIVGIGFFPDEVGLPADWSWTSAPVHQTRTYHGP